jgi:hypothetical protein
MAAPPTTYEPPELTAPISAADVSAMGLPGDGVRPGGGRDGGIEFCVGGGVEVWLRGEGGEEIN